jgi:hypothetical protein
LTPHPQALGGERHVAVFVDAREKESRFLPPPVGFPEENLEASREANFEMVLKRVPD